MIEIDDLHRAWKMWLGKIPDPFGPIAHDDLLFRAAPAALPGFQIEALAKLFGGLDGAGVGGGIRIADGVAFLVPGGLGEHTSQLGFPRMGRLAVRFALPAHRLFLHHRYSRPVHLHIQDRNRLSHRRPSRAVKEGVDDFVADLKERGAVGRGRRLAKFRE